MKILICGSRDWTDYKKIENEILNQNINNLVLITGGARGADNIAESIAKKLNIENKIYYAEWNKYGNAAGPIRNEKMIKEEKPNLIIAFQKNHSKGTQDTINRGNKYKIPVKIIN
jgi:hypothetical protein